GQGRAPWRHSGRPRPQAARRLRRPHAQCGRPCNHRRHDGIACDWVVDHLDGRGRADHLWRIAGACRLSDCIREQPLDYLVYLATAMRSGLQMLAGTVKGVTRLPESSKLPELRFNCGPVEVALAVIYAATEDDKRRKPFRARINYFRRAKVLGDDVEVGKGKQNAYSIVQIERWL